VRGGELAGELRGAYRGGVPLGDRDPQIGFHPLDLIMHLLRVVTAPDDIERRGPL
jgi:hypothetical protein